MVLHILRIRSIGFCFFIFLKRDGRAHSLYYFNIFICYHHSNKICNYTREGSSIYYNENFLYSIITTSPSENVYIPIGQSANSKSKYTRDRGVASLFAESNGSGQAARNDQHVHYCHDEEYNESFFSKRNKTTLILLFLFLLLLQ